VSKETGSDLRIQRLPDLRGDAQLPGFSLLSRLPTRRQRPLSITPPGPEVPDVQRVREPRRVHEQVIEAAPAGLARAKTERDMTYSVPRSGPISVAPPSTTSVWPVM